MRLLLDTHIWLWSRLEPAHLGKRLSRALEDETNELWLSPLSVWEALLLARRGKISLAPTAESWVVAALSKVPIREAPLTCEVVLATEHVHLLHRDPVDQFLAATARLLDLTLATADARLLEGTGFASLPNR